VCQREEGDQSGRNRYDQSMPDQTPLHQITYPLGTDRADIRVLETMARDVDRELGQLHDLNDATQGQLITPTEGTWTPTFGGGWIIGNATVKAQYNTFSSLVVCRFTVTGVASPTTSWGTSFPSFTLPFPVASAGSSLARFSASGQRWVIGLLFAAGASQVTLYGGGVGGGSSAGVIQQPVYQTVGTPAWASGNLVYGQFYYRRA